MCSSDLERAFDGVGAVADEEAFLQITGRQFAEQLGKEAAKRVEQLLRGERHSPELGFNGLDDLGMPDAHVVNAEATEAVDELPAHDVLDDRTLAGPFDGRDVFSFRDGFPVLEEAAVKVVVEVLQRVLDDAILVIGVEAFPARDNVEIFGGLTLDFLRFRLATQLFWGLLRAVQSGAGSDDMLAAVMSIAGTNNQNYIELLSGMSSSTIGKVASKYIPADGVWNEENLLTWRQQIMADGAFQSTIGAQKTSTTNALAGARSILGCSGGTQIGRAHV